MNAATVGGGAAGLISFTTINVLLLVQIQKFLFRIELLLREKRYKARLNYVNQEQEGVPAMFITPAAVFLFVHSS